MESAPKTPEAFQGAARHCPRPLTPTTTLGVSKPGCGRALPRPTSGRTAWEPS